MLNLLQETNKLKLILKSSDKRIVQIKPELCRILAFYKQTHSAGQSIVGKFIDFRNSIHWIKYIK